MSKYCIILVALLFVQLSSARVVRDAPQDKHPQTLSELTEKGEEVLKQVNEEFLKFVGVKSNDELVEKVQTTTKSVAESAKVELDKLVNQINNEKTQEFVGNIKKQFAKLTEESPAVTADAKALNDKFQTTLQKIIKDTQRFGAKLHTEGASFGEEFDKLLKTIVTTTSEKAKELTAPITPTQ